MKTRALLLSLLVLLMGGLAKAQTPAPSWGPVWPGLYGTRPVTAVGLRYQYSLNASYYQVFHRNIDGSQGAVAQSTASLWSIFQPMITSLNLTTSYPASTGIQPCPLAYSNAPVDGDSNGYVPFSEIACMESAYDSDVYYDPQTERIWILAHLRPSIWQCADNSIGYVTSADPDMKTDCHHVTQAVLNQVLHRYIAVAVSRPGAHSADVEDPANGFNSYILADIYGDWTQLMVHNGLVLVNSRDPRTNNKLFVFGAADLMYNGAIANNAILPPPSATFDNSNFNGPAADWDTLQTVNVKLASAMMFVRQQSDNVVTYLLSGTSDGKIVVYGLITNPPHLRGQKMPAPTLIMPAVAALPTPMPVLQKASGAYNNGYLYWGWEEYNSYSRPFIRTFRWQVHQALHTWNGVHPIFISAAANQGYIEADIGQFDSQNAYVLPTLNAAPNGDILTMFFEMSVWNYIGKSYKPDIRYAVLNNGTSAYQSSYLLKAGQSYFKAPPDAGGLLDIVSVAADPLISGQYVLDSATTDLNANWPHALAGVKP